MYLENMCSVEVHVSTLVCQISVTVKIVFRVLGTVTLMVKQPAHEADYSPPSSAKVKNVWSCTFTPPLCFHDMVLS